jgi:trk system potassium uptake protein TrkA
MRVIIVGAGEVGSHIAASLADDHEVIVVDIDPETIEDLTYSTDVLAIEGDGTTIETLQEAGIAKTELLVASTDDDRTNLITCMTAKTAGDIFAIARVRGAKFYDTWTQSNGAFDVDFMVSTDLVTAEKVVRILGFPSAVDVEPFGQNRVEMAEFEVLAESEFVDQTIETADRFDALTFAALVRDSNIVIPRGGTRIEAGDKVIVIGRPDRVRAFSNVVAPTNQSDGIQDFVVVGGSDIGYHIADSLRQRGFRPRLIVESGDRARHLAEQLPETVVMEYDITDLDFFLRENVDNADAVIAAADSDEENLLVSLLAMKIGVDRTVAVVEAAEYASLFEDVGIDVAINPRDTAAEEIVRYTRDRTVEKLSLIEDRQVEVLEVEIVEGSPLNGRPIHESIADLPADVVIGAITRDQEFIMPRGDTVIKSGDHVVLFTTADVRSDVLAVVSGPRR